MNICKIPPWVAALALSLLAGCATEEAGRSKAFLDEWQVKAGKSREIYLEDAGTKARFAEQEARFQPLPQEGVPGVAAARTLPTMVVTNLAMNREMDVAVVLRALAAAANQNIIFSDNVKGTVKFTLTGVATWDQVFLSILSTMGLQYRWEGDMIRVMAKEDIQRELEVERLQQQRVQVEEAKRSSGPLVTAPVKIRYANAGRLGGQLEALLAGSAGGGSNAAVRGSIKVDSDNNTILLNAVESDMERMLKLIRVLDQPTAQVLIQADIVQANSETARELGIQWGGRYSALDGQYLRSVDAGANANALADVSSALTPAAGLSVNSRGMMANFPAGFVPGSDSGFTIGFLNQRVGQDQILRVQLSALEREGLVNILSSPSITTLDNQTATIESGEERPFKKTTGAGATVESSIEWKKAALKLEVTPHVIDFRGLRMDIIATKDDFDDSKAVIIDGTLQVPITTRKAATTVFLSDGETTVIGGLSQESRSRGESGIPVLKDIPLLGNLFKSRSGRTALSDTLIFITPHIVFEPLRDKTPATTGAAGH